MDVEIPGVGGGDGGSVAVAESAGAGDDDAAAAAAAAGGEGGEAPPDPDAEAAAAASAGGEGGEGGEKSEPDLSDIEIDGRKIDAKTRTEIAELKKTNPAAAKKWAEAYFRNQAVMKETGATTPSEAMVKVREMKATIESLGGQEGIENLQTEVTDYRNEISQFAKGDPALIKTLGEANPEGLATAARNSLDWLKANKADIYKDTLLPAASELFESQGLDNTLKTLLALTKEGKGQEVYDLLNEVVKWRDGHRAKIKTLSEKTTAKDPREDEYARREREITEKEQKSFINTVETDVNRRNDMEIAKHIDPLVKELKLTAEGKSHFKNGLVSRIWKVLASDQSYLKQVRAIRAKGDPVKTADFVHRSFTEILANQFQLHRNVVYPSATPKPKPAAGAGAGTNGKGKVTPIALAAGQRPKADQVDWIKTTDALYATGKAYLKDGKFVQGFKDAPPNRY